MYGSEKNVKRNLFLFFADGLVFQLSMTLISAASVIPFFLEQLGASTLQIGMAASLALICSFISQPFFGSIASRTHMLHKTFGKVLMLQRIIFLVFVLCIPLFPDAALVWIFLFFWGVFNLFVGSYGIFYTPLMLKLLPPEKRGSVRGIGLAVGSVLSMGMASLIPILLGRFRFPGNYTVIFLIGTLFLIIDAAMFLFMCEHEDIEPRVPMRILQYIKEIPLSIRENAAFRAMVVVCMFLVVSNSLLSYYTVYAIKIFSATESHIATLTILAVISGAVGYIFFGAFVDRFGPKQTLAITACLVISAGGVALLSHSLNLLFVAWVLANLANSCYMISASLMLGEVCPPAKMPLYVGVHTAISSALSSAVLLALAPALERFGFGLLFATVLFCGVISLLANLIFLRIRDMKNDT